jgi:hypothetical protein
MGIFAREVRTRYPFVADSRSDRRAHGEHHGRSCTMPLTILLLAAVGAPDAPGAPHNGGKSANASWLYSWARPKAVIVSQRPPPPGTSDSLAPIERSGIPVLRTWQRGAVHFQWSSDHITTEGFLDPHDKP